MKKHLLLIGLSALAGGLVRAAAFGTAFTYQGRLEGDATPAQGIYDLRFAIYDAASGGSVRAALTNATPVTNGLFTVTLDFGSDVFDGSERWLEISVRANGADEFTVLNPRQALTAVPYASYAPSAGSATAISGSVPASHITGTISPAQLPDFILTNFTAGVDLAGAFFGNGAGLTNLSAQTIFSRSPYLSLIPVLTNSMFYANQGLCNDGSNFYFFGSSLIKKYSTNFLNGATNLDPFSGLTGYNHLGDGDYYDGKLFVAGESYNGCRNTTNTSIMVYSAANLSRLSVTVVSNYMSEISGLTVVPSSGKLYATCFCDDTNLYRFDLNSLAYLGTLPLDASIPQMQGLAWHNGFLYVSSYSGQNGLSLFIVDPDSGHVVPLGSPMVAANEAEGVTFFQNQLVWLAGAAGLYYFDFLNPTNEPNLSSWGTFNLGSSAYDSKFTMTIGTYGANPGALKVAGDMMVNGTFVTRSSYSGIDNNLLAYWPFDETNGAGGARFQDLSGNGNFLTVDNGPIVAGVPGKLGNGLLFTSGANARLLNPCAAISNGLTALTLSAWFNTTNTPYAFCLIGDHAGGTNGVFFFSLTSTMTMQFTTITTVNGAPNRINLVATVPPLNDGKWHLATATYNGTNMVTYLDGRRTGVTAQTGALQVHPTTSAQIIVGNNDAGSPYLGRLDEVRIWGRAITPEEVLLLWNQGISTNQPYCDISGNLTVFGTNTAACFAGNGAGLTNLPLVALAVFPLTNNQGGVALSGSFAGDGAGLTWTNAAGAKFKLIVNDATNGLIFVPQ